MARRLAIPVTPGAFRLFLAMLVFVNHFSSIALGAYAVYVFFILSGFWLQRMWSGRYVKARTPYFTYMVSRIWRLAPVMILATLATIPFLIAIGVLHPEQIAHEWLHLTFSSIFLLGYCWLDFAPVGSAWSLDVEMQFYLLAPLLALIGKSWRLRIALVLFAAICSFALSGHEIPILPKYILFFVIGMVAAQTDWKPTPRMAAVSATCFLVLVLGIVWTPWRGLLIVGEHAGAMRAQSFTFNIVLALISFPFAIYTTGRKSDADDRMMADLSYIVYLLHWAAMQWFFTIGGSFSHRLPYAALAFLIVPPLSWLVWRFYDKPINHARSEWVSRRVASRVSAVEAEVIAP